MTSPGRGRRRERSYQTVVMGPALDCPGRMGNSGAVRSRAWITIVDTQDQSPLGWVEVEPHDVTDLLDERGQTKV